MKRLKVQKVQAKESYETVNEAIIHLRMVKKTMTEPVHRKVESINNTPTNIHLTGKEVTPYPTMRKEMQTKYQSLVPLPEKIHRRTHLNASRIESHQTTVRVIIGRNIRRQINHHIKRQNRKNISSLAAIPRIIDNGVIHRKKMISIIKRRRKRVNVPDQDRGIEDNCFVFSLF